VKVATVDLAPDVCRIAGAIYAFGVNTFLHS